MKAINYIRWSTLEQGNNDRSSEYRQDEATQSHCQQKKYLVEERLVDNGVSAYTGANLETGHLGKLTKRFLTGVLDPREYVLVVEELDRLSRRPPTDMIMWITPLLNAGLTIETVKSGLRITQDTMSDMGTFMSIIMRAFQAFEFGETQKDRGESAWSKWREEAAAGIHNLTKRGKGRKWLEWDIASECWQAIPERVLLIGEMFQLRLSGTGKSTIAKIFNERATAGDDRYRVWEGNQKCKPKMWTTSAIARIVQDTAVTGYIQCHRSPRGKARVPVGERVKIYPAVISEELFAKANTERLTNQLKHQGKSMNVSNLIGPIGRCKECGGCMAARGSAAKIQRKDGTVSQHYFVYCSTAKSNGGCTNQRGWSYLKIEQALLDRLLTLAIDDQHFGADDDIIGQLQGTVARLERRFNDDRKGAERILKIISSDDTDELAMQHYGELKSKMKLDQIAIATAKVELSKAKGVVSPAEHIVRVADVRDRMESENKDERYKARSVVKQAFGELVRQCEFDPASGQVTVELIAGLGAMFIYSDYTTSFLDLVHPKRKHPAPIDSRHMGIVEAYIQRRGGNVQIDSFGANQPSVGDILKAMTGSKFARD